MSGTGSLGPLVRLRALKPAELPRHPDLESLQTGGSSPEPAAFATEVLAEAKAFVTDYWPKNFAVKSPSKTSPPSIATVKLFGKDLSATDLPTKSGGATECWFARTSLHENKKAKGTADWNEFESYLLDDHSKHESEYTPNVYDAHRVLEWDASALTTVPGWEKVEMHIYEMCHVVPAPLNPRTFAVLVVKGRSAGQSDFLTVQVPVELTKVTRALYATGRNRKEGSTDQRKKTTTSGIYVSIERAEMVNDGKEVKWEMATASDAKGNLPMFAQKMGVPGAIVKDVGLFMDWVAKQRTGSS